MHSVSILILMHLFYVTPVASCRWHQQIYNFQHQ